MIASMMDRFVKVQRTTLCKGWVAANIVKLYKEDVLDDVSARSQLEALSFSPDEIDESIEVADAENKSASLKLKIGALEKSFKSGIIDNLGVLSELALLGVSADRQTQLLQTWLYERQAEPHTLNVHELVDAVKRGLLTINQATLRLLRWNYDADSIAYLIGEMTQTQKR